MASSTLSLPGYRIVEAIYESANTIAYRAVRERAGERAERVVVKVPNAEHPTVRQLARWRYEHELLKDVSLPGVIRCHGLEHDRGRPALVLEDIGGESLRSALSGPMPVDALLRIAIPLVEALGEVHELGIVHKDINPSNVIVSAASGAVRIIDFGIASRLPRETQEAKNPTLLEGTLAYVSPEQTGRMNRAVDYRTDFYSLGMTFYHLLTGHPAFQASDPMELVHCHLARTPVPLRQARADVPELLSDIVTKLLAKTAEQRYQSSFGLLHDLRSCSERLARGATDAVRVGGRDVARVLHLPQRLFGRDEEVAELLAAFERASNGRAELVLVTGYSGIGKSSVVHEIHRPIVQKKGYFVSGKFEQYQRDTPYEPILQAFRQLVKQLLLESEERVARWRTLLHAALGPDAAVLIGALPELELVVGRAPAAPALGPTESQNRLHAAFGKLLGVFEARGAPLVVFLDDLQWADAPSLKLLTSLLSAGDLRSVLFVGAYRDNEVHATHPLALALGELRERSPVPTRRLTLAPLAPEHVRALVSEALHTTAAEGAPLADLLHRKTEGNPFFLNQLLSRLFQDGLVRFQHGEGVWRWDLAAIAEAPSTDNVVDLMVDRMKKLAPATQEVLQLAACTGSRFELGTLALVAERTPSETAAELWEALREGLILPESERYRSPDVYASRAADDRASAAIAYRFLHDRVHESALSMIPSAERRELRLKIGRLLLRGSSDDALDARLFDLVGHFTEGFPLVTDQAERNEIARIALLAGRKARKALAYETAVTTLRFGLGALPESPWATLYGDTFDLHLECLQCAYLAGRFEEADALFQAILAHARTNLEKAEAYHTRVLLHENTSRFAEAVREGIECLRLFGLDLDPEPSQELVGGLFHQVGVHLGGRAIHALLDAPAMDDPEKLAQCRILLTITAPAYFLGPNVFAMIIAQMVLLSVQNGNNPFSAAGYVFFGVVVASMGDHEAGFEYGRLARDLNEKYENPAIRGKVLFMFGNWLNYRKHHAKTDLDYLLAAYKACIEAGDLTYASYCCIGFVQVWFAIGRNLADAHAEVPKWLGFVETVKAMDIFDNIVTVDRAFMNLMGLTKGVSTYSDDAGFDEEAFERRLNETRSLPVQAYQYHHKSLVRYVFEDYDAALVATMEAERRKAAMQGQMLVEEHAFHQSLILAAVCPGAAPDDQKRYLEMIERNVGQLRVIAQHAPASYAHKLRLVEAEIARLGGEVVRAADLYDEAIATALENGYVHHAAIANECAARLALDRGKTTLGASYLIEAWQRYAQWGAAAKVKQLAEKHRSLIGDRISSAGRAGHADTYGARATETLTTHQLAAGRGLDLNTVTKASQTISREIQLDKLLEQLMGILIENAGAERGFILLQREGAWFVEAAGRAGDEPADVLRSVPIEQCDELPVSVVQYVARTGESVVLDDASSDGAYAADASIAARKVRSLVCVPAVNKGKLVSIVYLENNLSAGCFTVDRLEVLRILSSQIAISIDHAALYASLEEKVRERTDELRQTQGRLIALEKLETERQMAGGFSHEVRNALAGPTALLSEALGLGEREPRPSIPLANARKLEEVFGLFEATADPETLARLKAILREVFVREERLEEMLQVAHKSVSRALTITQHILEYAKTGQERSEPSLVDLNALVRHVGREVDLESAARRFRLELELDDGVGRVRAHEAQLHSMLKNVLLNARDAVNDAGRDPERERVVVISTKPDEGKTRISVTDNGVGISPENLGRVFEPFFTTKPDSGTGLGLALVSKIVSLWGGDISVRSDLGRGTTFDIVFPAPGA